MSFQDNKSVFYSLYIIMGSLNSSNTDLKYSFSYNISIIFESDVPVKRNFEQHAFIIIKRI